MTCLEAGDTTRPGRGGANLGIPYSDYILLQDGKVVSVALDPRADSYDALKPLRIARYGPPTQTVATTAENMEGTNAPSGESDWGGVKVNI
ncbi:hypothetical protein OKW37_001060 [Paraburkholderia sp. MM5482-R2]